jgi:S-adenosylmethionine-diacylgycerolhomoserine-N-methlytransferase
MPTSTPPDTDDPVQKLSDMYRWTRHVYDLSRRYYLLGRDQMLEDIAEQPAGSVLEIGCGTARNLRLLDEHAPQHTLYGLDASLSMLATAREKLDRTGCTKRITLGHGEAQQLSPEAQLHVDEPFDIIFFSYVLSMMPDGPAALRTALRHLAPNGQLYVVDFWDQADLPDWLASGFQQWLSLFDVYPRPDLVDTLRTLNEHENLSCTVTPVVRRYAYQATLRRSGPLPSSALDALNADTAPKAKQFDRPDIVPA